MVADNLPKKNGAEQPPRWFNVTAFGQLAETAEQYLHKGSQVLIQGRLQRRDYTTKDNRAGTSLDIIADKIEFLDPKGEPTPEDADAEGWPTTGRSGAPMPLLAPRLACPYEGYRLSLRRAYSPHFLTSASLL